MPHVAGTASALISTVTTAGGSLLGGIAAGIGWTVVCSGNSCPSLKGLEHGKVEEATQQTVRQTVTIKVGISSDKAREINRLIKDKGPKGVSSQTQGDTVRVTGKQRDDLQSAIALLKESDLPVPLQFTNFRD